MDSIYALYIHGYACISYCNGVHCCLCYIKQWIQTEASDCCKDAEGDERVETYVGEYGG